MTYTKHVHTCEKIEQNGTVMVRACIHIKNAQATVVRTFRADVNLAAHPDEAAVRAELVRVADLEIVKLTDADTIATNLAGTELA